MPRRRSRQRSWALIAAAVFVVAALGAGGYLVADRFGLLASSKDFSSQTGDADVLVTIPDNSTLTDFGRILSDAGVVGSSKAFISAADNQPLAGGIYKLRTGISAATAVEMMSGETHRVGRLVVPEGVQLEAKRGVDRKTVPGVFDRIETVTSVDLNGEKIGITVEQLENAAKTASAEELGIPAWAREAFADLAGDYRRIEGLVAPGTWEAIDPKATPVEVLHHLITDSTRRYESWGLLSANNSGLKPYEVLVAASVAEREVNSVDDLPKVARVILNRLDKKQRLEMDSTTNYTAAETNIDVHGENYKADTRWNTYRVFGLPPTPIATVGEKAMKAMLDPPEGNWLYFITVDKQGTTKFSATFKEHLRNRKIACDNKFLRTGC
ncbi:endolytic transglycosylase MltG [Gordonia araii NBRC 100433]|nr:endolytic transglycosylase MltG [Gordonia araii NBRC 100433]